MKGRGREANEHGQYGYLIKEKLTFFFFFRFLLFQLMCALLSLLRLWRTEK